MSLRTRLSEIQKVLSELSEEYDEEYEDEEREQEFKDRCRAILRDVIAVVEEADQAATADNLNLPDILEKAEALVNTCLAFAYTGELNPEGKGEGDGRELFINLDSFANTDGRPLLQIERKSGVFSRRILEAGLSLLKFMGQRGGPLPKGQDPWRKTLRIHPLSTKCARFVDNIPNTSPAPNQINALSIFQARAEVSSGDIPLPLSIFSSPSGKCMLIPSQGGYKNRIPYMTLHYPDDEPSDYLEGKTHILNSSHIASHGVIDDESGLLFIGDHDRTKSYSWWDTSANTRRNKPLPVHTLQSSGFSGAVGILPGGRVARAGVGKIALWNFDDLETHGPKGTDIIGESIDDDDLETWRDDPEDIERSSGTPPHITVTLSDPTFKIGKWHPHPASPGVMLATSSAEESHFYHCRSIDLGHDAKIVTRYLGHGGEINAFSTSKGDPNVFVTACDDGYARLYDVRHPLPVLTIEPAIAHTNCTGAVLCHPDGVPYIFASDAEKEAISLWDIRAKAPIYELATGNNSVVGMVWNDERNELFAATECQYVDRNGRHMGYAEARIPVERPDNPEEEEDEDEEEEYEVTEQAWPKKAYHSETHFGHIFDSGEHRIFRYAFKSNPNPLIVPPDGDAMVSGSGGGYGW